MALGVVLVLGCGDDGGTDEVGTPDLGTDAGPSCAPPSAALHELVFTEVSGDCGALATGVRDLRTVTGDGTCTTEPLLDPDRCAIRYIEECVFDSGDVSFVGTLDSEGGDVWAGQLDLLATDPADGPVQCFSTYQVTASPF